MALTQSQKSLREILRESNLESYESESLKIVEVQSQAGSDQPYSVSLEYVPKKENTGMDGHTEDHSVKKKKERRKACFKMAINAGIDGIGTRVESQENEYRDQNFASLAARNMKKTFHSARRTPVKPDEYNLQDS